ncbi:MAG: FAD-linked oxidase C-terminal domain-containing protein [Bacteroidota bacterium]
MAQRELQELAKKIKGELYTDETIRKLYATDASAYREMPLAVAIPKNENDLKLLVDFASKNKLSLIPRTAGTSLAGQVVGAGIVVDVSKHFTKILEVDEKESWVRVQPGVVRDELNLFLKDHNLFFGPETSTANRAMIGGMVGNNSCGANSIIYGSTRDHLIEIKGFLSDGSEITFKALNEQEFAEKLKLDSLEGKIYKQIQQKLFDQEVVEEIKSQFPKESIPRRNTGYAIDLLADTIPFKKDGKSFNFCKLVAGSEGTLVFITEIKLNVEPLPPKKKLLICAHFNSVNESLRANLVALEYNPSASELMDHYILECTKANIEQQKNRFFVKGDPSAILVVELSDNDPGKLEQKAHQLIDDLKKEDLGYHFPIVEGTDIPKVWTLRKAGLGLLSNIPGDAKAVPVIEDTAVDVSDLPDFIKEFNLILEKHKLYCVHYAHAGSGELHLRPIINLKTHEGNQLFKVIANEIAHLVKKYNGSLSGEHGDGRLRGEFIEFMIGKKNYDLLREIKQTWDPNNVFNPGKIVDTPSMNSSLRYEAGKETPEIKTYFDFSEVKGVVRAAELCNGSGDCRKTHLSGGTMCPSYMATKNEKETTRARANILREVLTHSDKLNRFDSEEIKEVMDLCLSCKGCKSECPSNVDVGKLKAEFLQQYHDANGIPLRSRMIANFTKLNKLASVAPAVFNASFGEHAFGKAMKSLVGFAPERSIPKLQKTTLKKWFEKREEKSEGNKVYFFCDEFTNYNDVEIGKKAILLLEALGYQVEIPDLLESGRTYLSKGLLREAKKIALENVNRAKNKLDQNIPIVGLEPSAILTFRDEYIDLLYGEKKEEAKLIAQRTFTIEEFLSNELGKGRISKDQFIEEKKEIKLHGHCHQKAVSSLVPTKKILSLSKNYSVQLIPSGCCGMAGSFGYEKEHFEISQQIGELVLFPAIRKASKETIIAAPGTSCRHQIKDGTGREALHPVEILYDCLRKS